MGSDLVAACVLCSALLLRQDFRPAPRFTAELLAAYSTLPRETGAEDHADVTTRTAVVGLGWARPPRAGLGAGTPATEWRARAAFGVTHDEASESAPGGATATGNGRLENEALLARLGLFDDRDSVEAVFEQRRHVITDLVSIGGPRFGFTEQRDLNTERNDIALGWRHRFPGAEVALRTGVVELFGKHETAAAGLSVHGFLPAVGLELRAARGAFTASLFVEGARGSLGGSAHDPAGARDVEGPAWLLTQGVSVAYSGARVDTVLSISYDRSLVPFVTHAVRGSETRAIDAGATPEARGDLLMVDVALRTRLAAGLSVRPFLRYMHGSEEVRLTGASGEATVGDVKLGTWFPPLGFVLGLGLEMSFGTGP